MVTIVDAVKTLKKDGSNMIPIVVQGAMEPVVSSTSGRIYMTAKKTRIPCTFSFEAAKAMIGQTMPGTLSSGRLVIIYFSLIKRLNALLICILYSFIRKGGN